MAPLDDVRRGQHRQQPAGRDQDRRRRRRRLQVPVHGQGRRQRQQELPVPGDQGAAQREDAAAVAVREDEDARHRGLPAVPPRRRHRRHVGRVRRRDGQAGQHALPRHAADRPARPPATRFRDIELEAKVLRAHPADRHRRPVRRQVLLPRRAHHPPAPPRRELPGGAWPCRAAPTARRSARSPPTACSSSSSRPTRRTSCPTSTDDDLDGDAVVHIDLNRPMDEIRAELEPATR